MNSIVKEGEEGKGLTDCFESALMDLSSIQCLSMRYDDDIIAVGRVVIDWKERSRWDIRPPDRAWIVVVVNYRACSTHVIYRNQEY